MADHSDIRYQAGEAAGQAQVKKDSLMEQAAQSAHNAREHAAGVLQQTGDQMRSMAHTATDTVKNAVGMGDASSNSNAHAHTTTTSTTTTKHA